MEKRILTINTRNRKQEIEGLEFREIQYKHIINLAGQEYLVVKELGENQILYEIQASKQGKRNLELIFVDEVERNKSLPTQADPASPKTIPTSGCSMKSRSRSFTVQKLLEILNDFESNYEVYVQAECTCNANSTAPYLKGSVKIKAVIQAEEGCADEEFFLMVNLN